MNIRRHGEAVAVVSAGRSYTSLPWSFCVSAAANLAFITALCVGKLVP